jgi:hypothetical protein
MPLLELVSQAGIDSPGGLAPSLTPRDAIAMLVRWQDTRMRLAILYARSRGGVMMSGYGTVKLVGPKALRLDIGGARVALAWQEVHCRYGEDLFFSPDLIAQFPVIGLSIELDTQGHVFLSESPDGAAPSFASGTVPPARR